jgi:hypothetical protein
MYQEKGGCMNADCKMTDNLSHSQLSDPSILIENYNILLESTIRAIGNLVLDLYFDKSATLEYLRKVWSYELASVYKYLEMFLETANFEPTCPIYKWVCRTGEILRNCREIIEALKEKEQVQLELETCNRQTKE